ncbi:16S rRNA (guanine(1207)-N(2))-methyltransferase RsmC [Sodalis endosymbiont of Henestaris halophilus]|uniref:16S rRNA (guanine(1207)-N(2))-methyltransferase RsmC n=1 Tax=Sodalis endosymbiont of Henestaris halophilus TaxID=1929246 RepID=UPI000BBFA526|nr:16S rRNA (guanine(1207)-N(2))-methyltransferase RsmC [Sodalis endosymbiont of Henestaris halophilus]SNC58585.1 Ribosomal RNA small subunit methyltransferase C [Sodalis endosymbiont of Henestaris halophilus]
MYALKPASKVILRHQDMFLNKQVLIAGNVQDLLPAWLNARSVRVHTAWFHYQQTLVRVMSEPEVQFGLVADTTLVSKCETLIYFWPKNKSEALFQLTNLLSLLPLGCDVFVVGDNRCGVRRAESMLELWCPLSKIDGARRCGLYYGKLVQQTRFDLGDYWQSYLLDDVVIKTLPGVFGRNGLDKGSQLLLSTFKQPIQGNVADIGCGSGVLSAVLAKKGIAGVRLTLSDVHAPSLAASIATLRSNGLQGDVLASDVYSAISGYFDMIISNSPFHNDVQINLKSAVTLIRGARDHLRLGGELRIVANSFLPYPNLLDEVFGNHQVLAKNGRFKVYQAFY